MLFILFSGVLSGCRGPSINEKQIRLWSEWVYTLENIADEKQRIASNHKNLFESRFEEQGRRDKDKPLMDQADHLILEAMEENDQLEVRFNTLIDNYEIRTEWLDFNGFISPAINVDTISRKKLVSILTDLQNQRIEIWREVKGQLDDLLIQITSKQNNTLFYIHNRPNNDTVIDTLWQYYFPVEEIDFPLSVNGMKFQFHDGMFDIPNDVWHEIAREENELIIYWMDTAFHVKFKLTQ